MKKLHQGELNKNSYQHNMKRIIFRFWMVNVLLGIILSILYRVVIVDLKSTDTSFLEGIFNIIDLILNLSFSAMYLVIIAFSSLSFFLNQIDRIRNSNFFSFLSFSGIPFLCVVFLAVTVSVDIYRYHVTLVPLKILLIFSIIYLLCTVIEFLVFRRIVKKQSMVIE